MAVLTKTLPFMLICGLLGGCGSWVGEERSYDMQQEIKHDLGFGWAKDAYNSLDIDEIFQTSQQKEMANEQSICLHANSQERVVTQNGVSDAVDYRRCPLAAYPMDGGSRLGNRPDGNGTVAD